MGAYYGLIVFIGIIRLLTKIIPNKKKSDDVFVLISFVAATLLQGARSIEVGTDIPGYMNGYYLCGIRPWFSEVFNYEVGYRILCKIIYLTGASEQVFLLVVAIICQGSVFNFIRKHSRFPAISIVIYLTFGLYTFSFSGLRQMIAIAIVLFSYDYIKERKIFHFLIVVLFASLFHTSAVFFIVAYPLYYMEISMRGVFMAIGGLIAEAILGGKIVQAAMLFYKNREYETQYTGAYMAFIMYVCVWLGAVFLIGKNKELNSFENYILLAVAIQELGMYHMSIARLGYYFSFFICLLLPEMVVELTKNDWKMRCAITTALVFCCFLYFNINTGDGYLNVCPYIPFWG